jgi:hypothetical protein
LKNSIFKCAVLSFFIITASVSLLAQKKSAKKNPTQRCSTMEYLENQIKADPTLPAKWKAQGELIQQQNAQKKQNKTLNQQSITIIPVVFHLVIDAGDQAIATDAKIQRQVDVLNRDFAGLNPDSSKLPAAFKAVFGHSQIRFCLAKRTPNNMATNGIERRVTNATFTINTIGELKKFAGGGLDQWDGNKYLNIWAANFSDNSVGLATFPSSTPVEEQGICIDWGTLDLDCASPFKGVYDGGRTLVHEVGHYFYLWHIWGDENGCTGDDFAIQDGFPLSGSCTDDTPNQSKATTSCLSGLQIDACSPVAPGFMYQNYMDYTYDDCYAMFTLAQACRMQSCLDNYRASLKTSNGCIPIVPINNDVRVSEILNPASRGFSCGAKASYCNAQLAPQVLIVNDGDAPLTSLTFTIKIDGNIVAVQNWAGNLAPAGFAYANINAFLSPAGEHTLRISTSNPNGGIDSKPSNDFADAAFVIVPPAINPPIAVEGFEAAFPPINWRVDNPDNATTWAKTVVAGNPGIASARLNAFLYNSKPQTDYLITPKIKTTNFDSLILNFNVAYAKYSNEPSDWDELEIVYSDDCGTTWKPTGYKKSGDALATNGGAVTGNLSFVPTIAQWRAETVRVGLCQVVAPEIAFAFKSTNNYGNNIYVDNVSIDKVDAFVTNAALVNLASPIGTVCNEGEAAIPKFTLINNGTNPLTAVTFNVSIDGKTPTLHHWTGNLARCFSAEITLPPVSIPVGDHSFLVYATNPNGVADQSPENDTLKSKFRIIKTVNAPLAEGFESNVFPPNNFIVQNPDAGITWERTIAATQSGIGAMVIKNYKYVVEHTTDTLLTPSVSITKADSAFVSFDYAYARGVNDPKSDVLPLDTLEIAVSKDCGLTSTVVWKKWGEGLQTINDPNFPNNIEFIPTKQQWKNVRISLPSIVGFNDQIQAFFTAKSNKQNNLYIDNINIFSKTLPQLLKDQGYLIYPNPFNSSFLIHHYQIPINLRSVQLFNSIGELVWDKRYAGNANTEININLGKLANGVYILKMLYTDKAVIERVVKN